MENVGRIRRVGLAALAAAIVWSGMAGADPEPRPKLAILPFEINDTSGEAGTSARHDAMLAGLTHFSGERIAGAGLYDLVPAERVAAAVAEVNPGTFLRACNGCELDIARRAGADAVMIGWVWKVSTLIGTLHVAIKDVASGRTTYAKVLDFRGDNEQAWQRAVGYMVESMRKEDAAASARNAG